ncbi:hypothetical protein Bbelb_240590 [Branchiostoma belcheri]|nr:hypothetical protein Bbelb_240580 [Branchiostoma belcheri]KAI8498115.1 hypothetical protein Bbelb_240590 [Branchiostoma belcheri]
MEEKTAQLQREVSSMKILGIHLQANLKWNIHVDTIYHKASQRLYLLCKLKHFHLPIEDLVSVYISYIRPVMEYGAPVWHSGLSNSLSNKIEKVQRRALRIILGASFTSYGMRATWSSYTLRTAPRTDCKIRQIP